MRQLRPSNAAGSQPMRSIARLSARVKSIGRQGWAGSAVGSGRPDWPMVRNSVPQAEHCAAGRAPFEHLGDGRR